MFKYNNTHIFTGYLKQLLSSFNLPTCRVYTNEFAAYREQHGTEDPRVLESFDTTESRAALRINYVKNNGLYNYFCDKSSSKVWKRSSELFYSPDRAIHGLTRTLNSHGQTYDIATHEYLGDYLRFLRDYYNINLMSMYNCFNDKIYNNVYCNFALPDGHSYITLNSQDTGYRIYAIPVKLFAEYTIAIDCSQSVELFCGLYNTSLEISAKAQKLAVKTYTKINKTIFNRPFLYDKLNVSNWLDKNDFNVTLQKPLLSPSLGGQKPTITPGMSLEDGRKPSHIRNDVFTRWDIITREKDLRLFIKVPTSCKSSIVILEGDYREFNSVKYLPVKVPYLRIDNLGNEYKGDQTIWTYKQNHSILNFNTARVGTSFGFETANGDRNFGDGVDLNNYSFKPISRLQLLAFNTGESYPFADRLVEYLSGSAITPIDEIADNIIRVQRTMEQNRNYFKIDGIWEDKMQNILYDYMVNSGPVEVKNGQLVDRHSGTNPNNYGYHPRLGHTNKSTLFDVIGYVDKDTEKWYASWIQENGRAIIKNNIQNIDIYKGLYDI